MSDAASPDQTLSIRVAAIEVIVRRLLADAERRSPGLLDRLSGPYELQARPSSDLDAFVGAVDDQVSTLLALARAEARAGD